MVYSSYFYSVIKITKPRGSTEQLHAHEMIRMQPVYILVYGSKSVLRIRIHLGPFLIDASQHLYMYNHIFLLIRYGEKISSNNVTKRSQPWINMTINIHTCRSTYISINISCSYLYMEHRFRRNRYERTIFYEMVAYLTSTEKLYAARSY